MRSVRQKNGTLLTFANPSFQSKVEPDLGVFEVEGGAALSKEIYYAHEQSEKRERDRERSEHRVRPSADVSGQVQVNQSEACKQESHGLRCTGQSCNKLQVAHNHYESIYSVLTLHRRGARFAKQSQQLTVRHQTPPPLKKTGSVRKIQI